MKLKFRTIILCMIFFIENILFLPQFFSQNSYADQAQEFKINLQMSNVNIAAQCNTLNPKFILTNKGLNTIPIKDIKIRYFYTLDGEKAQNFWCDWSNIGSTRVLGSIKKMNSISSDADYYLEVGFSPDSGNLNPNQNIEIHSRIAKSDWTDYSQANDFSFTNSTSYVDWSKAVVLINGSKVLGNEPASYAVSTNSPNPAPNFTPSSSPALSNTSMSPKPSIGVASSTPESTYQAPQIVNFGSIVLQMYNVNRNDFSNSVGTNYKIVNKSNITMDLKDIKIRYYYMYGGDKPQNFWCDWCSVGASNVVGKFIKNTDAKIGADYYLEISFTSGSINPQNSLELKTRFARSDWKDYYQCDDYSFNSISTEYSDWDKALVFYKNNNIWGNEPTQELIPKIDIKATMVNQSRSENTTTINPNFRLKNNGNIQINLDDVKIRYYYTSDGNKPEKFWCDWSSIGESNVMGSFFKVPKNTGQVDSFLEVSFKNTAGAFMAGDDIEINTRFAKEDWSQYLQSNDYSFKNSDQYTDWNKIGVYVKDKLVWGEAVVLASPTLSTKTVTENNISFIWDSIEGITSYDVEVDGVVSSVEKETNYNHSGLQPGTEHTYRLRAKSQIMEGEWSQPFTIWTLPDVPNNIVTSGGENTITVKWAPVTGASGYDIEIYNNPVDTNASTEYTIGGLNPNTQNAYRVRAKNSSGVGQWSSPVAASTLPGIPENLKVVASDISLKVFWDEVSGATSYEVEIDEANIYEVHDSYFNHIDLSPNSNHSYRIRSMNAIGKSSWSKVSTFTTLPSIPSKFKANCSSDSIKLEWNSVIGATGYDLDIDGKTETDISINEYIHKDLKANTTHEYKVRARNGEKVSLWSDMLVTTTLFSKMTGIDALASSKSITLKWNSLNGALGYDVEVDNNNINRVYDTLFKDDNLTPNTLHTYRIRAINNTGAGEWSDSISKYSLLEEPVISNILTTSESIKLEWSGVVGAEEYNIMVDGKLIENISDTYFIVNDLKPNSRHVFRLNSQNDNSKSEWGEEFSVTTIVAIPAKIITKSEDGQNIIAWDDVDGVDEYELEIDDKDIISVTEATYKHFNLEPNTLYSYRVRAANKEGKSEWSNKVMQMSATKVPTGVSAIAESRQITIKWDIVEKAIYYDLEIDGNIIEKIENCEYVYTGLFPNSRHTFRVRAYNEGGSSGWTEYILKNTSPEMSINFGKDNIFNFLIVAPTKAGVSKRTVKVTYNPDDFTVIDLCSLTPKIDLNLGSIKGTKINIIEFSDGLIVYEVNDATETTVNSIKFQANGNSDSKITYTIN